MEAENVLNLLDSHWYNLDFFKRKPSFSSNPHQKSQENITSSPEIPTLPTIHTKSPKVEKISSMSQRSDSASPNSVLFTPRLQTIFSGKESKSFEDSKEVKEFQVTPPTATTKASPLKGNIGIIRRQMKGFSKSLSDLEFEELKGFMDLGFVFAEEDKDSNLASIIPGLQRLGKKSEVKNVHVEDYDDEEVDVVDYDKYDDEDDDKYSREGENMVDNKSIMSRPYLSEAWGKKKRENSQMKWTRVPAFNSEIDMKDYLRLWAHTVASTVNTR